MMNARRICGIVAACICLTAWLYGPAAAAETARPNIILCMADDQGWGDVGYAGHPVLKTPNLEEMAGAGLRFDRFYAAAPVCSPTRGSVMTGRHPNRFGCFTWGYPLRPQEITLAQSLKAAGYVTGHFGKWHLGSVQKSSPVNPGACGFDKWLSSPNFWEYPASGTRTPSKQVMSDLMAAQVKDDEIGDRTMLFADAAKIERQYPTDSFAGHAAWLDWPWKLHRLQANDGAVKIELYDLVADPQETNDESSRQPDRVKSMRADLERWLASVTASLNGKDY